MKELFKNQKVIKIKAILSIAITFGFVLYNGFIGFKNGASWNISIAFYYLLLFLIKTLLIVFDKFLDENNKKGRMTVYIYSFILLLLINLALIVPGFLLMTNNKNVVVDQITSIAMATYSFYNIAVSIINLKKQNTNLLGKQLRLVLLINAIVSMMVLENTLINVNGSFNKDMFILSFITTFIFIVLILFLTIYSFVRNIRVYLNVKL